MKMKHNFNITVRIRFNDDTITFYGKGISQLLQLTEEHQSIHAAAKEMGMSYSKALKIIKRAEEYFDEKLLNKKVGGLEGGGSSLTDFGKMIVNHFQMLEHDVLQYTIQKTKEYFPNLPVDSE